MIGELWALAQWFFANPETNRLAQWFFGILAVVIGFAFMPHVAANIAPLSRDRAGMNVLRGLIALAGAIALGIATAVAVGMLAR